jgi:hypothetical protein
MQAIFNIPTVLELGWPQLLWAMQCSLLTFSDFRMQCCSFSASKSGSSAVSSLAPIVYGACPESKAHVELLSKWKRPFPLRSDLVSEKQSFDMYVHPHILFQEEGCKEIPLSRACKLW